jgi:transcription antitermination factor NusG
MGRSGRHGTHPEAEARWIVVRYLRNHDQLAIASLTISNYETYLPRTRQRVALRFRTVPLFQGYLFVRLAIGDPWRPIEKSLGVHSIVKAGGVPARVPDVEIGKLLARSDADGVVRLPAPRARRPQREGMRVLITEGALRGFEGLHTGLSSGERELILLNVLGAPRQVAIAAEALLAQ